MLRSIPLTTENRAALLTATNIVLAPEEPNVYRYSGLAVLAFQRRAMCLKRNMSSHAFRSAGARNFMNPAVL